MLPHSIDAILASEQSGSRNVQQISPPPVLTRFSTCLEDLEEVGIYFIVIRKN